MPVARSLALLLLLAPAVAAQPAELKRVHVLIAADTSEKAGLAQYVKMDVKNFREMLADHLPADVYKVTELTGTNLTATNVRTYYQTLDVLKTDALVFYYSGHGSYRGDGDPKTPGDSHTLEFQADMTKKKAGDKVNPEAMTRKELKAAMLEKKAGLTVILTDCCSDFLPVPPPPEHKPRGKLRALGGVAEPTPLGRSLFLTPARKAVDITAAADGQVAMSDKYVGSYFTHALDTVATQRKDKPLDWKGFAAAVSAETQRVYKQEAAKIGDREMLDAVREKSMQRPQSFELPDPTPTAQQPAAKTGRWAVIALDNPTDKPVKLQIRWGTAAAWSKPFTMPAGQAQFKAVEQPAGKAPELTFQVMVDGGQPKTLQAKLVVKDTKPTGKDGNVYLLPDCTLAK